MSRVRQAQLLDCDSGIISHQVLLCVMFIEGSVGVASRITLDGNFNRASHENIRLDD